MGSRGWLCLGILVVATLVGAASVRAEWTAAEITELTAAIAKEIPGWTAEKTRGLVEGTENSAIARRPYMTAEGMVLFQIMGKTVLLNGKDVSRHRGSKPTPADDDPMIGDPTSRQVANQGPVQTWTLTLALVLSVSVALNAYLLFLLVRAQRRARA